ncbi:unannotated protein [freshwater metagenome]|uniref:Unannotated protein n=1 Tax=freshwater metagenome TaxID=449393 RepID=A0A6J6NSF1_9ZZZZ
MTCAWTQTRFPYAEPATFHGVAEAGTVSRVGHSVAAASTVAQAYWIDAPGGRPVASSIPVSVWPTFTVPVKVGVARVMVPVSTGPSAAVPGVSL